MIDTLPANTGSEHAAAFKKKNKIEDFTDETIEVIKIAQKLVQKKKLNEAIDKIMAQEKKARLAGDFKSVETCCNSVLLIFKKLNDFENLNKYISVLCKRRNQSETVQTNIITLVADRIIPSIKIKAEKEKTIAVVRELSAGKIMLEVKRAELTMLLSHMKQEEGDFDTACKVLNEETPETYTSMERSEKIKYILEQTFLCLKVNDFIRAKILLKKIDKHSLEQLQELKIRYYRLSIDYSESQKEPLEAAKAHLAIYRTLNDGTQMDVDTDEENALSKDEHLKRAIIYLAASKYSNEQVDMIHHLLHEHQKTSKHNSEYFHFIKHFVHSEVIQWPFPEHQIVSENVLLAKGAEEYKNTKKNKQNEGMNIEGVNTQWLYSMLFDRVIQHDLRLISGYYSCIFLDSLAQLLNLSTNSVEDYISGMVSSGDLKVKIDRADGIVNFKVKHTPDESLTEWTSKINELMGLVDKTCHLIHKENMIVEAKNNS